MVADFILIDALSIQIVALQDLEVPVTAISLPGDSGSLWVDGSDSRAVGLHFAGEDDASPLNDYALAHPIEDIFASLNASFAPA